MKVVIFTGNGFDLALGLDTRYEHLLGWLSKNDFGKIPALREFVSLVNANLSDGDIRWCDLENALALVRYDRLKSMTIRNGELNLIGTSANYAANIIIQLKQALKEFLLLQQGRLQLPLDSTKMAEIRKGILEKIFIEIESFLGEDSMGEVRFLNLNYTNTLSKIFGYSRVVHVHGKLEGNNPDSIIIGVDRNRQSEVESILGEYAELVDKNGQISFSGIGLTDGEVEEQVKGADLMLFFGVSFGDSDYRIWKIVARQLLRNCSLKLIVWKYDKNPQAIIDNNEMSFQHKWKYEILNSFQLPHKEEFASRIHIPSFTSALDGDFWGLKEVRKYVD